MSKITVLIDKLNTYKDRYYDGSAKISDEEFDRMENELRILDPTNKYFDEVSPHSHRYTIKHKVPMLSLMKIHKYEDFEKWLKIKGVSMDELNSIEICFEPKLDGVSGSIVYNNSGFLEYASTRGDGILGKNIDIIKFISNVPKKIPHLFIDKPFTNIEIRGEFIIPISHRIDLRNKFGYVDNISLRNVCAGIINRKKDVVKNPIYDYINFVVYDIIIHGISKNPFRTHFDKLNYIRTNLSSLDVNFCGKCVLNNEDNKRKKFISVKEVLEIYTNKSAKYNFNTTPMGIYETDGIVFTINNLKKQLKFDSNKIISHHHHFHVAFKFPSKSVSTKISGVSWDISRNGKFIPVLEIEPATIRNVIIKRVTLNNVSYMDKLKLGPGDTIIIELANDVIPKIQSVLSKSNSKRFKILRNCPHCNTNLISSSSSVNIECPNLNCPGMEIKRMTYWTKMIGMRGVGQSIIEDLYEIGIRNIFDLYNKKELIPKLISMRGYSDKKINSILRQIHQSQISMTTKSILVALGISGCSEKTIDRLNPTSMKDFITKINSRIEKSFKLAQDWILKNKKLLLQLSEIMKTKNNPI